MDRQNNKQIEQWIDRTIDRQNIKKENIGRRGKKVFFLKNEVRAEN